MSENIINFDDFKVRCSSISKVLADSQTSPSLTEKQSERLNIIEKKDKLSDKEQLELIKLLQNKENRYKLILSDGCIDYLMESYSWITAGKISVSKESMDMVQTRKGTMAEDSSIELLSIVENEVYYKNDERVSNEFLSGEPDIFKGDSIMTATKIVDIKSLWDYPGFLKNLHKKLEKGYKQQVQGYCDITGATEGEISKCLVNTPPDIIEDMKYRIAKKFGAVTVESPDFLKEWDKWERSMIFDDLPVHKRVFKIKVDPFTDFERNFLYDRVKVCREWLNQFHESYQLLNM